MTNPNERFERCQNDACPRPAEPMEGLCAVCSLEWSLFHREERPAPGEMARRSAPAGR